MAITVTLKKGLTIGDTTHLEAELREPAAGDILDASEDAEKLVLTPDGYQLLASPTLVGVHMLRRQVVRIGEHPGPLTLAEIRKLSSEDLELLQKRAQALDGAVLKEIEGRGRMAETPA